MSILPLAFPRADFLAPGTRLGRYELLQRLAIGGMAELYLARATGIQGFAKLVALKRILPQHAVCDEFVAMFLDEARLAATLRHANIAQVYDIGQCERGLFFTMEFVHGEDVRALLKTASRRGRPVPLEHALAIVAGAAAGLHAAHIATGLDGVPLGIVHRDVSPSNVLVSFDGCVKVIDFGVAKATRRQSATRSGGLKGKVSYMSPEQCRGDAIDQRSDVFALGILLYELTTGTRLFAADNELAILQQIVWGDIDRPSFRIPGYPPQLERIVMRALARDPDDRFPSAQALQLALEHLARDLALTMSSAALGAYMRELFAGRLEIWQQLQRAAASAPVIPLPLPAPEKSAPVDTRAPSPRISLGPVEEPDADEADTDVEEVEPFAGEPVDTGMFEVSLPDEDYDVRPSRRGPLVGLLAVLAVLGALLAWSLRPQVLPPTSPATATPPEPENLTPIEPTSAPSNAELDPPPRRQRGRVGVGVDVEPTSGVHTDAEPPAAERPHRERRPARKRRSRPKPEPEPPAWDPDSPLPPS